MLMRVCSFCIRQLMICVFERSFHSRSGLLSQIMTFGLVETKIRVIKFRFTKTLQQSNYSCERWLPWLVVFLLTDFCYLLCSLKWPLLWSSDRQHDTKRCYWNIHHQPRISNICSFSFVSGLANCCFSCMYSQFSICIHKGELGATQPRNSNFLETEFQWHPKLCSSFPNYHSSGSVIFYT